MEQRKHPRHSIGGRLVAAIKHLLVAPNEIVHADIVDLSHEGAGLSVEVFSVRPYEPNDLIYIEIELSDGSTIGSYGEVKWVKALENQGGYRLGVLFMKIDNQNKARLQKFLADLDKTLA